MSYLIDTSIPPLHKNWDIKDMVGADNLEEIQEKVNKYISDPNVLIKGNNLYMYSTENGTGKTRVATYIVSKLHEPRLDANQNIVVTSFAIVSFGEYLKFCAINEDARAKCMQAPILLLDDVSQAWGSKDLQAERRELLLLMKYRREHLLLTIITSNLIPTQFEKLYGATAYSKVLENFSFIEVKGGDVRPLFYPDQLTEGEEE